MGELHLEIIVDRMKREFTVEANVGQPQVAYRETIRKDGTEIEGKYIPWCSLVVLPGGLARREVVWHEFLHHLLDKNGRDFESVHHKAPEFKKCEKPLSQKNKNRFWIF